MLEGGSGSKETKSNADNPENKSSESEKTQKGLGKIADKLSALFSDDIKDGQKESDLSEKSETKEAKDTADFENGENKSYLIIYSLTISLIKLAKEIILKIVI